MSLEHILLGMLHKPASGYDLKVEFEAGGRYIWSAELSQIYPTLQKMQKRGWLRSRQMPSEKGPPRKVYMRTPRGTAALHRWLREEPILGSERFAYIAQLIFLGELNDLSQTIAFLQQLRAKLASLCSILESASRGIMESHDHSIQKLDDQAFHEWISLQMGIRSLQAKVACCDEACKLAKERQVKVKKHV